MNTSRIRWRCVLPSVIPAATAQRCGARTALTPTEFEHDVQDQAGAGPDREPEGSRNSFRPRFSQSWLSWRRQMSSDLANDYRLALDLRGHGQSDKPRERYADRLLWADDILAVTRDLHMEQPVLCGWSYGPIVILDYVRAHGEDDIGGVSFVDGLTKLGSDEALSVLSPKMLSLVPGLFATETEESVRSLSSLLRMCFVEEPSSEDLYLMLGYNFAVPPYVREALFSRSLDNDDLLPTIRKPVQVVHGTQDAVVKPAVVGYKWLLRGVRDEEVAGSNPVTPTTVLPCQSSIPRSALELLTRPE